MIRYLAIAAIGSSLLFSTTNTTHAAGFTGSVVIGQPYPISEFPGCEVTFRFADGTGALQAVLSGASSVAYMPNMINANTAPTGARMTLGTCGGVTVYGVTVSGTNNGTVAEFVIDIGRTATSAQVPPGSGNWVYSVSDPKDTFSTEQPVATAPSAPTDLIVTPAAFTAEVAFTAPSDDGGAEITEYQYRIDGGDWSQVSEPFTTSPILVSGLAPSTQYTVAIRAVNSAGGGTASAAATFTTSDPIVAPSVPSDITVEVGDGQATVSYVIADDGGTEVTRVEYKLDDGNWNAAPDVSGTILISGLENGQEYSIAIRAGHLFGTSEASAAVSFTPSSSNAAPSDNMPASEAEVAVTEIIQSDAMRSTRSAIAANNSMMLNGLTRFMGDRLSGIPMSDAIATRGNSGVSVSPTLRMVGDTVLVSGTFSGQTPSSGGGYRRVTFGEFDVQHEPGSGSTLSFNGRVAWERSVTADSMLAYFLGAEINQSSIESDYDGTQDRYGLLGGIYAFKALENNLFLAGYVSVGTAQSSLDITDGANSNVRGDFASHTLSIGGQLSGTAEYDGFELRPLVNVNIVKTWIGDIALEDNGTALDIAVGDTTFAELVATPEFRFPLEQGADSHMVTVASIAPRVICEWTDAADTVTSRCGSGLELGVDGTSEDGTTSLTAGIRFDRVGGIDRQGLNLQARFRF